MSGDDEEQMVLTATCHDVRNLAAMLRGLSFASRAIMSVHKAGLQVSAEDNHVLIGTAYVPVNTFDEFVFKPDSSDGDNTINSQDSIALTSAVFEFPIDAFIECLNIFGSGAPSSSSSTNAKSKKQWKNDRGEDSDDEFARGRRGGVGRAVVDLNAGGAMQIDQFFPHVGESRKTGLRMGYGGVGHPLTLRLMEEAGGPLTTVELTTYDPEAQVDLPFDDDNKVLWLILSSHWLTDALSEFDSSCDTLIITANPITPGSKDPCLKFEAGGNYGSCEVEYPQDPYVIETFDCQEPVRFLYRLAHISRALRALQSSSRTSMRIDNQGVLSMQFMMKTTDGAFVEFRFGSLEDEA